MSLSSGRWKRYAESKYPHEREALEYLRENLPNSDPVLLYSNFEFIADDGSVNEVDALVVITSMWDGARFEAACEAGPAEPDRVQLVSDLAATVLTTARHTADFVSLGEGLSIMSRHAKSLGYDAVILFLDELILWLASRAASVDFVTREAPKLVNLVESSVAERPVPIVSFVARQRDLRTVLGEQAVGSEVKNFEDALNYFEARFDQIRLEDRNLPTIAEKRLLVPKDSASAELIRQSFESVKKIKESVREILLTQEGDLEQFRQVYPFSPALVKTLVGVPAALQRERTALKIMVQLLVDQRDTLHLDSRRKGR